MNTTRPIEFFGNMYDVPDDYIVIDTVAVRAAVNWNYDEFTEEDMEKAADSYNNCNLVFFDHTYTRTDDDNDYDDGIDRTRSRGFVVAQHYENGKQYLLIAVSKEWTKLCEAIEDGSLNAVSMGCDCSTWCSECGTEFTEYGACFCGLCPSHIGTMHNGNLVHDVLKDITYYEISIVPDPAECTALFRKVYA